jgi:predicted dehydrogenase
VIEDKSTMDPIERALSERPLQQAWPLPGVPQPIVVIGAGGIVRSAHLPAYARIGLPVLGLFDPRSETAASLAEDFAVSTTYGSLDEAIEAARTHEAVFDLAVPAGAIIGVLERIPERAAILIQKPFGRDLKEARTLLSLCREKSLRAAVNFQLRFSPNMLALGDAIGRGLLGTIIDVEVRVNVNTPWQNWDFLKGIPRHEILYHSIHYLDSLRLLFGEPRGVHCKVTRHPELPDYSDLSSATILDYGEHLRCAVSTFHGHDYGARHQMSQLKVEGTKGVAVLRMGVNLDYPKGRPDTLELASKGSSVWHEVELRGGWFDHAFEGTMSNLQRHLCGEHDHLVSAVEDATRTMALVEACYQSSQAGSTPLFDVN